ncbi:MAG: hypothetical protein WC627_10545 [Legionella sp.]|jgi:hypothetical protein
MYFLGELYDPLTNEITESESYSDFINEIQQVAILEFDENTRPNIEHAYLWIKLAVSDSKEELSNIKVPYFRLNKMLIQSACTERLNPQNPGRLLPAEIYDGDFQNKYYPGRYTGALYLTAMANLNLDDDGPDDFMETFLEFSDKETEYPKSDTFNCILSGDNLKSALDKLQELLDYDPKLLNQITYQQALVTACFFIAEAVRFNIVQFAAMNMLNLNQDELCKTSEYYQPWSSWKAVILEWQSLCGHLDKAGMRSLNPLLQIGIPINAIDLAIEAENPKKYATRSVFTFFPQSVNTKHLEQLKNSVLNDFLNNYPGDYYCSEGIYPRDNYAGRDWDCYATNVFNDMSNNQMKIYVEEGKTYSDEKNFKQAAISFARALDLYHEHHKPYDQNQLLSLNYQAGLAYFKHEEYDEALSYLSISVCLSETIYGEHNKKTESVRAILNTCQEKTTNTSAFKAY